MRAFTVEIHAAARMELKAAKRLGERVGVLEHRFSRVPDLREAEDIEGPSPLSKSSVPATYIPMKNAVYYSLAAGFAEERASDLLIGGHNADDRKVFADTGEEFFVSLQKTLVSGSPRLKNRGLKILRPLRDMSKPEVIRLAVDLRVPLELTWSCHRDGNSHCWKCDGCMARVRAFAAAGVEDPLTSKKV